MINRSLNQICIRNGSLGLRAHVRARIALKIPRETRCVLMATDLPLESRLAAPAVMNASAEMSAERQNASTKT